MTTTIRPVRPTRLDKTLTRTHCMRSGRHEVDEATSADGRWVYSREEMPGTPWLVTDRWTPGQPQEWFTKLPDARRWTAEQPAVPSPAERLRLAARRADYATEPPEDDGTADSTDPTDY